jgi:hypothetical protein
LATQGVTTTPRLRHSAPHLGPSAGGFDVTLNGINLDHVTAVVWNNEPVPFVRRGDDQIAVLQVPPGDGPVPVWVTSGGVLSNWLSFRYRD